MNNTKIIVVPGEGICPHCSKPIKYSIRTTAPSIYWMLKQEDLDVAKNKAKKEIEKINFKNPDNKQEVLNWLNNEGTQISPDEADEVVKQIRSEEAEKWKENK